MHLHGQRTMNKVERQQAILNLIGAMRIGRQEELVNELAERGIGVTQASVSRDLDELGVVKVNGAYAQPGPRTAVLGLGLITAETAGPNLIVAKTASGLASAATVRWPLVGAGVHAGMARMSWVVVAKAGMPALASVHGVHDAS